MVEIQVEQWTKLTLADAVPHLMQKTEALRTTSYVKATEG